MQLDVRESADLARSFRQKWRGFSGAPEVVLCPSHVALAAVHDALGRSSIGLGAQDAFWEAAGSYTGEVSPLTLAELGCRYVIVGHSERRALLGETDVMVAAKAASVSHAGLTPIICVGERQKRGWKRTEEFLRKQLQAALSKRPQRFVVAYEPVWAIGTGIPARPEDVRVVYKILREELVRSCHPGVGRRVPLLYGGSVDANNAKEFIQDPENGGLLVGRAGQALRSLLDLVKIGIG